MTNTYKNMPIYAIDMSNRDGKRTNGMCAARARTVRSDTAVAVFLARVAASAAASLDNCCDGGEGIYRIRGHNCDHEICATSITATSITATSTTWITYTFPIYVSFSRTRCAQLSAKFAESLSSLSGSSVLNHIQFSRICSLCQCIWIGIVVFVSQKGVASGSVQTADTRPRICIVQDTICAITERSASQPNGVNHPFADSR